MPVNGGTKKTISHPYILQGPCYVKLDQLLCFHCCHHSMPIIMPSQESLPFSPHKQPICWGNFFSNPFITQTTFCHQLIPYWSTMAELKCNMRIRNGHKSIFILPRAGLAIVKFPPATEVYVIFRTITSSTSFSFGILLE